MCKGQDSSTCALAAPPVVINFHPLPRDDVSITRQPQPGSLLFHQSTSHDHVIVIDLRKQKKPSFHSRRRKSPRTTLQALSYMSCLSHSVIMLTPNSPLWSPEAGGGQLIRLPGILTTVSLASGRKAGMKEQ